MNDPSTSVPWGLRHLAADLDVTATGPARLARLALRLLTVRGLATLLFRLSQDVGRVLPPGGMVLKQVNHLLTGGDLAWQAEVGGGLQLFHPTGVVIGPDVVMGERCAVQACVTLGAARQRGLVVAGRVDSPVIGDDVKIGAGAVVVGPITLGDGVVVGANAAVVRDAPAGALLVGVPATVRVRSS